MNKYIRTTEGIYEEAKVNLVADALDGQIFVEKIIDGYTSHLEKVIKQAETKEELCDEFVLDHPIFASNCKTLYHSFEKAKNGIKKTNDAVHSLYEFKIYGAIWTEKGLIYVAKMNENGVLELI